MGGAPGLAHVFPARRKRTLIFAVDRLSVCLRIEGRGTALIFFASVSDLAVPSSPSPEGMTCQPLSVWAVWMVPALLVDCCLLHAELCAFYGSLAPSGASRGSLCLRRKQG